MALALTKDFKAFERYGVIMQPEDKDAAFLPRRIDGCWALIQRPGCKTQILFAPFVQIIAKETIIVTGGS